MNFETALKNLTGFFEEGQVSYALIGGFALGLYGVVRSTSDLDFLIDKNHQANLKNFMAKLDYKIVHESADVIQFESEEVTLGDIDFLYAFRKPSLEMLSRAVVKKVFGQTIELRVLIPEDIIGLKVQSMVNNPQRAAFDMEDIRSLIAANSQSLNWSIIEGHFSLFGLNDRFKELEDSHAG